MSKKNITPEYKNSVNNSTIPFPKKKYKIIYADPPWEYDDKLQSPSVWGSVEEHYDVMSEEEISNLPIQEIADNDCILFIWGTWPKLQECLGVIANWGFNYRTVAFVWVKTFNGRFHRGMGRWTRSNTEFCLLAKKGKIERKSKRISQLIKVEVKGHSKKPDVVRKKILELVGDLPRIELFARTKVHGWDVWGNDPKLENKPLEAFN